MNHMLWPTALSAALLFWLGFRAEGEILAPVYRAAFVLGAVILAVPGILFVAYYTGLLGEPIWLYEFRAWPYTELAPGGIGLVAGFLQRGRHQRPVMKRQVRTFTV